jgi:DnaJ-class molecular chaperone
VDHYELLGVRRDASAAEVKKAYERKIRGLRSLAESQRAVQEKILKDAVEVLTDEARRVDYDSRIDESEPMVIGGTPGAALLIGLVVVALTAAGIGYFLFERSKDQAQMRADERRKAELKYEKDHRTPAPAPSQPAKR